jgi:hypothetical protein
MEFDRESEFERIMEEIFPVSIPAQFVKSLVVKLNNGHSVVLKGEELLQPLPISNDLSWDKLVEQFDQIEDIEVFIDMPAIQNNVSYNVKQILSAHFKDKYKNDD